MDPELLRAGFRLGVLILALALITLPFQNRSSAEFVVTVLAAVIGLAFTLGVGILARRAAPPLPSGDKRRSNQYNGDSRRGKS